MHRAEFTLSTGEKSNFYFDCKRITLEGEGLALMADLMLADRPLGGAARGHGRPHHGRGLHHGGGGNAGVSNGPDHGARLHRAQKAAKKQRLALDMVIHHDEQISMLRDLPEGHRLGVWLKVDSGMHRLGFAPQRVRGAPEPPSS